MQLLHERHIEPCSHLPPLLLSPPSLPTLASDVIISDADRGVIPQTRDPSTPRLSRGQRLILLLRSTPSAPWCPSPLRFWSACGRTPRSRTVICASRSKNVVKTSGPTPGVWSSTWLSVPGRSRNFCPILIPPSPPTRPQSVPPTPLTLPDLIPPPLLTPVSPPPYAPRNAVNGPG